MRFLSCSSLLVDQSQVAAIRNQEKVLNAVNDPALAASRGVEFGADIIIIKSLKKNLTGSVGRIQVEYEGNGEALADALLEAQTAEVPFEIIGVSTAKIDGSMKAVVRQGREAELQRRIRQAHL
jgi:hypothetical protein